MISFHGFFFASCMQETWGSCPYKWLWLGAVWWSWCRVGREGCCGFHLHFTWWLVWLSGWLWYHHMIFLKIASCIKLEGMDWSEFRNFLEMLIANCGTGLDANISRLQFHFLTGTHTHIVHNRSCIFAILLWFSLVCCIHKWKVKWTICSKCSFISSDRILAVPIDLQVLPSLHDSWRSPCILAACKEAYLVGSTENLVYESLQIWMLKLLPYFC